MPTYDYRCEVNGRVVEVQHKMNDMVRTWGELCSIAGIAPEGTPSDTPVKKLATGGQVVKSSSVGESAAPPCASGPCCGGGSCGFN